MMMNRPMRSSSAFAITRSPTRSSVRCIVTASPGVTPARTTSAGRPRSTKNSSTFGVFVSSFGVPMSEDSNSTPAIGSPPPDGVTSTR